MVQHDHDQVQKGSGWELILLYLKNLILVHNFKTIVAILDKFDDQFLISEAPLQADKIQIAHIKNMFAIAIIYENLDGKFEKCYKILQEAKEFMAKSKSSNGEIVTDFLLALLNWRQNE